MYKIRTDYRWKSDARLENIFSGKPVADGWRAVLLVCIMYIFLFTRFSESNHVTDICVQNEITKSARNSQKTCRCRSIALDQIPSITQQSFASCDSSHLITPLLFLH